MNIDKDDRVYVLEWTKQQHETISQMVYDYIMMCDSPEMQGYSNGHHWIAPDCEALQNLYNCIVDARPVNRLFAGERYRLELSHRERIQLTAVWSNLTNWYLDHEENKKKFYLVRDQDAWLKYKAVRKKTVREAAYEESAASGFTTLDAACVREESAYATEKPQRVR